MTTELGPACDLSPLPSGHWTVVNDGGGAIGRTACLGRWRRRRALGKLLSVLRLFKAAFTFNQPLEYILWKVERRSGLRALVFWLLTARVGLVGPGIATVTLYAVMLAGTALVVRHALTSTAVRP